MISPEGEIVEFGKGLKARGNVEDWLVKVEAAMFSTIKKYMKEAINDFLKKGRQFVIYNHASQVAATLKQFFDHLFICLFIEVKLFMCRKTKSNARVSNAQFFYLWKLAKNKLCLN